MNCFEGTLKSIIRSFLTVQFSEKSVLWTMILVQESFVFLSRVNPCSPKQAGLQQDSLDIWLNWSQLLMSQKSDSHSCHIEGFGRTSKF